VIQFCEQIVISEWIVSHKVLFFEHEKFKGFVNREEPTLNIKELACNSKYWGVLFYFLPQRMGRSSCESSSEGLWFHSFL